MEYTFIPKGVCPSQIKFDVTDGILTKVRYTGGCNGNLQAVSALVEGMKIEDVIKKLEGIHCGFKKTSCADQLTQALKEIQNQAS